MPVSRNCLPIRSIPTAATWSRHGLIARARFVGFGGGVPVEHQGQRVGGLGISGGSEAQDDEFARQALADD